jgi:hypothetical protein
MKSLPSRSQPEPFSPEGQTYTHSQSFLLNKYYQQNDVESTIIAVNYFYVKFSFERTMMKAYNLTSRVHSHICSYMYIHKNMCVLLRMYAEGQNQRSSRFLRLELVVQYSAKLHT